jgi:hypothetical protein
MYRQFYDSPILDYLQQDVFVKHEGEMLILIINV